jgi:hypothetical protein
VPILCNQVYCEYIQDHSDILYGIEYVVHHFHST